MRSGGDERAVSQEWDRPATVELGGGADVVGEADIDQLSAAGAVAKRGRDIIGERPIRGRCGVCFGGDTLPSAFTEEIDETAGSPLVLNGGSELAFRRARVAMLIVSHARLICHNVAYRIVPATVALQPARVNSCERISGNPCAANSCSGLRWVPAFGVGAQIDEKVFGLSGSPVKIRVSGFHSSGRQAGSNRCARKRAPSIAGVHDRGDVAADGGRHCGRSA